MVFYGASYGSVLEGYTFLQMFVGVVLCQLVSTHILNDPAKTCLLVQVPYEWMHQLKESCDSVCPFIGREAQSAGWRANAFILSTPTNNMFLL